MGVTCDAPLMRKRIHACEIPITTKVKLAYQSISLNNQSIPSQQANILVTIQDLMFSKPVKNANLLSYNDASSQIYTNKHLKITGPPQI